MFDGCLAIAKAIHAAHEAKRERQRIRRNERAKAMYKLHGRPVRKPKPEIVEPTYEAPTSCFCSTTSMPPCSWCTDPNRKESDYQ